MITKKIIPNKLSKKNQKVKVNLKNKLQVILTVKGKQMEVQEIN